jgi:Helix-turn-helix domain
VNSINSQSIRNEINAGFFQPEPYVTADDLAAHLNITRRQVLEMTRRGLIPARPLGVGKSRHVWRYKISEVESAIASGIRKPTCESNNDSLARSASDGTIRPGSSPSLRRKSNG